MRYLLLAATILTAPTVLGAQARETPKLPDAQTLGWQVRADNGHTDASKLTFVEMKPGWHVTTGPLSGVMFHPGMTGAGNYAAQMGVYFFPPKSTHHEGYGIVVGGKDLAGAGQEYTYFMIRNDGKFLIKSRTGATTANIMPWTAAPAITLWKEGGPNVLNVLRVEARTDSVVFKVNDVAVVTKARTDVHVDGVVGMRVNHFLDLHVRDLTVVATK